MFLRESEVMGYCELEQLGYMIQTSNNYFFIETNIIVFLTF